MNNNKKQALMLMKTGDAQIKHDKKMGEVIEKGIFMLETEQEQDIGDLFMCGLGYEKVMKYEKALDNYEKCLAMLPESSMYWAILGMKYRVLSKMNQTAEMFDMAIDAFVRAGESEEKLWRKQKWEMAQKEMMLQKERKWK